LKDKICLITGANSGIGKATALGLAKMGATVVMVCRDHRRGEEARAEIKAASNNPSIDLMVADLSSQVTIRQIAQDFQKKYQQLHVLVNNAGVALMKRSLTVDGLETTFAVNHLAPFLLTNLLLDMLKASAPSRIINVSSSAHMRSRIDFDDLQEEKNFSMFRAYNQSKLANVLFTYELAKKLKETGVTVNALHPGVVRTNLGRDATGIVRLGFSVIQPFIKTPEQGAATCVYLASSPEVERVTGKYFVNNNDVSSSKESYNETVARRLWEVSEQLTQIAPTHSTR
jgi:NAD(P)-dependent dehydrogenase (short-subunit alcohol dehydrogenase family)